MGLAFLCRRWIGTNGLASWRGHKMSWVVADADPEAQRATVDDRAQYDRLTTAPSSRKVSVVEAAMPGASRNRPRPTPHRPPKRCTRSSECHSGYACPITLWQACRVIKASYPIHWKC